MTTFETRLAEWRRKGHDGFDEAKHPRGPGGKFASSPGGGSGHGGGLSVSSKDLEKFDPIGRLPKIKKERDKLQKKIDALKKKHEEEQAGGRSEMPMSDQQPADFAAWLAEWEQRKNAAMVMTKHKGPHPDEESQESVDDPDAQDEEQETADGAEEMGEPADMMDEEQEMPQSMHKGTAKKKPMPGRSVKPATVADRRAATRDLVVIRSCPSVVHLVDGDERTEPSNERLCRASYRVQPSGDDNPVMTLKFSAFDNSYEINSATEGKFIERVAPGAFSKTIMERANQIKVMFNHGQDGPTKDMILGKVITLEERADGAHAEVELFDTSYNKDLLPGLRAGVYGSSFMFHVVDDEWNDTPRRSDSNPKGLPERTVKAVRLLEFGPVTWPANPATSAGLRSHTDDYADRVRSANPDRYEDLASQYARFREVYNLTETRDDAPTDTEADTSPAEQLVDDEVTEVQPEVAQQIDDAPDSEQDHASDERNDSTNSAETRHARLVFAGIYEE